MRPSLKHYLVAATILTTSNVSAAPNLDLNDFLPPTQGGSTVPSAPVEKKGDVISAPNMQAGMASAFKQLMDEGSDGVKVVATSTGMGILSAATANYHTYDNINATNLDKRGAYMKAFTEARKELVAHMNGIKNSCESAVKTNLMTIDTGKEGIANSSSSTSEKCGESVEGMLAAYIVYSVNDNVKDHSVSMVIASSTKTRGTVSRIGGAEIVTDDPQAAFKDIATEISSFATPPMGAKMIVNPRTNEDIIIGFGSAIVRQNSNPEAARELKKAASDQARTRARNALVSFLQGDKLYWSGGFDEKQMSSSEQFANQTDDNGKPKDPLVFDKTKDTFLNTMQHGNDYQTVTQGNIPPGVQLKNFTSEDGYWEFCIAVYMASQTAAATQAGAENRAAGGRLDSMNGGGSSAATPPGHTLQKDGGINNQAPNPQGPSGQVAPKKDF